MTLLYVLRKSLEGQEKALQHSQDKLDRLRSEVLQQEAFVKRREEALEETKEKIEKVLKTS